MARPPASVGDFVGREREGAELANLLGSNRLVTLTGPPGVGKTRLARQLARRLRAPDTVHFVDLADVADPASLVEVVARQLGIVHRPGPDPLDGVAARLGDARHLVVLDDCECVVAAIAEVVDQLLHRCRNLQVLATSREALAVAGESVLALPPLSIPGPGDEAGPDAYVGSEAVQLFCDRAAAVQRGFFPTPDFAPAIVEICRRLDGLPLAIELAAARLSVLSLEEIVSGLDDRFTLLTSPSKGAAGRHRSLRDALDRSYDMLSGSERVLLGRLSVFRGGCTLEAAEEVCPGGKIDTDDVLDLLDALVAKSLVVAETTRRPARYTMLESVRDYAFGCLAHAGEASETQARQARWCLRFLDDAPRRAGGGDGQWLEGLDTEEDNLAAALAWAAAGGRVRTAVALVARVVPLWWGRGRFAEAQPWLERALSLKGRAPGPVQVKLLIDAGLGSVMLGDVASARPRLEEALALATELGDPRGRIEALKLLGFVASCEGETAAGLALMDEAVALARRAGDNSALAQALAARGRGYLVQGRARRGRGDLEESMAAARGVDPGAVASARVGLGWACICLGDYDDAQAELEKALASVRQVGDRHNMALVLAWRGELHRLRGDDGAARSDLEKSAAAARHLGTPHPLVRALLGLGRLAQASGDGADARRHFADALSVARASSLPFLVAPCLVGLGEVAQTEGELAGAHELADEALTEARGCGDLTAEAHVLDALGRLARAEGDEARAAPLHHEALTLRARIGDRAGLADSLEAMAGVAVADGHAVVAARLFGAAHAQREAGGFVRPPWRRDHYEADMAAARDGSGRQEFATAWSEGAGLSLDQAVAHASKGRGRRKRPSTGWAALTPAERQVVELVAQGLTNAEVAEGLFVSAETVKAHLSQAFRKLGVHSRRELRATQQWKR